MLKSPDDSDRQQLTPEEARELLAVQAAVAPFFAENSILGRRHAFAIMLMPQKIGPMSVITNEHPGRIADCMSHYIVANGYAKVFPHSAIKPNAN